jgi:hypothetical protein
VAEPFLDRIDVRFEIVDGVSPEKMAANLVGLDVGDSGCLVCLDQYASLAAFFPAALIVPGS